MNVSFYSGVSGMVAYQQMMDVIAHNISNVKTTGYMAGRSSFSDLLYTQMNTRVENMMNGHGVKNDRTDLIIKQGTLNVTNFPLDFAMVGDGFFAVERNGETQFTRNGEFSISSEGNIGYLVSKDGGYVLDNRGREIKIPKNDSGTGYNFEGLKDIIGIYKFSNPFGLERRDASSFVETSISGTPKAVALNQRGTDVDIRPSTLEFSSVNLGDEMIEVIQAQRAFQLNSKMVQTSDQIEEMVNNLR